MHTEPSVSTATGTATHVYLLSEKAWWSKPLYLYQCWKLNDWNENCNQYSRISALPSILLGVSSTTVRTKHKRLSVSLC